MIQMVMIGVKSYAVNLDDDRVYVETQRFPETRTILREIPKTGPRAIEARRLAVQARKAQTWSGI